MLRIFNLESLERTVAAMPARFYIKYESYRQNKEARGMFFPSGNAKNPNGFKKD